MQAKRSKYSDTFVNDRYGCVEDEEETKDDGERQGKRNRKGEREHDMLLKLAKDALRDYQEGKAEGEEEDEITRDRCGFVSGSLSFPRDGMQQELLSTVYQPHLDRAMGLDALPGQWPPTP